MKLSRAWLLLAFGTSVIAATAEDWRTRSIYQIVTDRFGHSDGSTTASCDPGVGVYCGGTWQGIVKNLDYIQNMGFDAIWISPITSQLPEMTSDLASYHGYWQQDIYKLNSAFGTEGDLRALSDELHKRGMYLMVDVVVNHFAWAGDGTTVDYSRFNPFNSESYFHPFRLLSEAGANDSNSTEVEQFWIGDNVISLPDVRTEDPKIASMYYDWIKGLVSNYSVDGLRIDTVLNVNPDFFPGFNKAAGVFCIGEVFNGDAFSACPLQQDLDSLLNYPMYFNLVRAFNSTGGSMSSLVEQYDAVRTACKDIHVLGNFAENQDQARFPSFTPDISLAKNIIAYTMLQDGIPILYYGQEQHFSGGFNPVNREALWLSNYNTSAPLYNTVKALNGIRSHAIKTSADYSSYVGYAIYNDTHTVAFRKGFPGNQIIMVLSNSGENSGSQTINLKSQDTGLAGGAKMMEILGCKEVIANSDGGMDVTITNGVPGVYYPSAGINATALCQTSVQTNGSSGGQKSSAFSLRRSGRELGLAVVIPICIPLLVAFVGLGF